MATDKTTCGGNVSARYGVAVTALAAGMLALTGCSSPETQPAPVTTTAAANQPAKPADTPTDRPGDTKAPKPAKLKVPDGVGLDYQSAQDVWRAAGLHVAPAEDAKGAHRIPVLDANWIVVSQTPKAGTQVDAGSSITATVKKSTDD
jgi:hypothetical protein